MPRKGTRAAAPPAATGAVGQVSHRRVGHRVPDLSDHQGEARQAGRKANLVGESNS
jgi:hypothetical protein